MHGAVGLFIDRADGSGAIWPRRMLKWCGTILGSMNPRGSVLWSRMR